jgi:16S rRNA (cytosine967-C5)-methyltransferase
LLNAAEILSQQQIALDTGPYLKLLPHLHQTDGFFAAVFEKTADTPVKKALEKQVPAPSAVVAEAPAVEKVDSPKKASTVKKTTAVKKVAAVKKATATEQAPVKKPAKAVKVKADKA